MTMAKEPTLAELELLLAALDEVGIKHDAMVAEWTQRLTVAGQSSRDALTREIENMRASMPLSDAMDVAQSYGPKDPPVDYSWDAVSARILEAWANQS